jgi:hypothetical protein
MVRVRRQQWQVCIFDKVIAPIVRPAVSAKRKGKAKMHQPRAVAAVRAFVALKSSTQN